MTKAPRLSTSDTITILGVFLGLLAVVADLNWIVRGLILLAAIALVIFAAWRHPASLKIRAGMAAGLIAIAVGISWKPIWEDFRGKPIPDVTLRFSSSSDPVLILENRTDAVAHQGLWQVALWNLDEVIPPGVDRPQPLQIPATGFEFLRPRTETLGHILFGPSVRPLLKEGSRIFGSATVNCADCVQGHSYLLYVELGKNGWSYEVMGTKDGGLFLPPDLSVSGVRKFFDDLRAQVPESERHPMLDR